ncbi:DEAD/DEAH box helicase [Nannocystaceae bacterium ST9]
MGPRVESLEPSRAEARQELVTRLETEFGAIPSELLADHLLRCLPDQPWPVLRAAAEALIRRRSAAERENLEVGHGPGGRAVLGDYHTRRPRQAPRPYRTMLRSLAPLQVSCDCADFLLGGLALCKHALTVLDELHQSPRRLARARATPAVDVDLSWDPIVALEAADMLAGIHWTGSRAPSKALAPVFGPPDRLGRTSIAATWRRAKGRAELVARLHGALRRGQVEPAVHEVLRIEHAELERLAHIAFDRRALAAALAGFRLRLYPYQRQALTKFLATGRLLLADDMGLGKTVQATAIAHALVTTGKVRRVLIICPASLKGQWVREWRRASEVPIEFVEGSPEQRAALYAATRDGALVANYEQALRDLELMRGFDAGLAILDEAQRIKNWATRTAQAIKQIDAPYRLVLTGTPLENRLDELASIMDWVDPQILAPKWMLAPAHQILADGERDVIGMGNLGRLRARLEPRMLRRRRAEILADLPERTDTVINVEITQAQRQEHDELDQPIARLVQAARRRPLTQPEFLRLMSLLTTQRVIANGLAQLNFESLWPSIRSQPYDESLLRSLAMPKLAHLRTLVESLVVDQGRKIIVFSQWRRMLSLSHWAIADLLTAHGRRAAFFTGAESQRRRRQNVIEFHDDPELAVLLSTDAGGVGLNLQRAASACVHLELPWNPAVFEQRVGRIHRLGQSEPVDVYALVTEASIESRIAEQLGRKQALFDELFDGESDEVVFDGSTSFLASVEALVDLPAAAAASELPTEEGEEGENDDTQTDARVHAADERGSDRAGQPTMPDPEQLRGLFSELEITALDDGGVRIHASPRAAQTLGALFAGMADLLAGAASKKSR